MNKRIITISREFGSGGRTVGKLVAELLGISFYDKELIDLAAKESGFSPDFVREQGEEARQSNSFLFSLAMSKPFPGSSFPELSPMDQLFITQSRILKETAEREPCVIVGRCADYVLKDREDCLNTFVYADPAFRARRVVEVYGQSQDAPEKRISKKDQSRKVYYRHYTNRTWGVAHNYHICLDSGVVGIEACATIIAGIARGEGNPGK